MVKQKVNDSFYLDQVYYIFRAHPDYEGYIYNKARNASFPKKLKYTHYNSCSAMTGAIKGSSI